jgi:hypothetical protein
MNFNAATVVVGTNAHKHRTFPPILTSNYLIHKIDINEAYITPKGNHPDLATHFNAPMALSIAAMIYGERIDIPSYGGPPLPTHTIKIYINLTVNGFEDESPEISIKLTLEDAPKCSMVEAKKDTIRFNLEPPKCDNFHLPMLNEGNIACLTKKIPVRLNTARVHGGK